MYKNLKNHTRIPVTAQWLWDNANDEPAYIFNTEKDHYNIDPWVEITGVDATNDGSAIILNFGRTGEKRVSHDFIVYISKNTDKGSMWVNCGGCFAEGEFIGLSRKDNKTPLCPTCAQREAMYEYRKGTIGG